MKQCLFSLVMLCIIMFQSCQSDSGIIKVTYQEANAIYGNLEDIRQQNINEAPTAIIDAGKVYVSENFILIGEEEKGIHVVDNSDINNPSNIAFLNIPGNREFFVKDNMLYAETYYDVIKLDISDPTNSVLLNRAESVFNDPIINSETDQTLIGFTYKEVTKEMDEQSDFYSELLESNVVYYDFAKNIIPKSAVPSSFAGNSSQSNGTVNRIAHTHDHLFIISSDNLFIINDGDQFTNVTNDWTDFNGMDMETIFPKGDNLFIGSRSSMEIYDISNPQDPKHVYDFQHATSCDPVLPVDQVAYVTLRTADFSECPGNINALVVLDISDLSYTNVSHEIEMSSPYGMSLINDQLYVGEGENGLKIFDASDKLNPTLITTNNNITAYDILAHPSDSKIILIAGTNGLEQYLIDDQMQMTLKSTINF